LRMHRKMSDSEWVQKNATLSHKNAMKEFGLSENQIFQGMKSGKLQYRENYAHGNPYFRVLRSEVKKLAIGINGTIGVEKQEARHRLNEINRQINSFKRKLKSLEKEKNRLVEIHKL